MYNRPYGYDIENEDVVEDITFWLDAARKHRAIRILELACGTGRLAIPLAQAGFLVTGLDISEGMLERCSLKLSKKEEDARKNLTLHLGDMRDFDFDQAFDLIFIGFNSVNHLLTIQEQLNTFRCVYKHLGKGGRFMVDVYSPNLTLLAASSDSEIEVGPERERYTSGFGDRVRRHNSRKYFPEDQLWSVHERGDSKPIDEHRTTDSIHVYFPRELHLLYMHSGFEVEEVYGDYSFGKFVASSPRMIFVGRKV